MLDLEWLKYKFRRALETFREHASRRYVSGLSRTQTRLYGTVRHGDESRFVSMPLNADGAPDFTIDEIGTMTILCAWCQKPIFVADRISLKCPIKPAFCAPEGSVVHQWEPLTLVGCDRDTCCDTIAELCGCWYPDPSAWPKLKGKVAFYERRS